MRCTVEILWENGATSREPFDVHGGYDNAMLDAREHYELQPWEGVKFYDSQTGELLYSDD